MGGATRGEYSDSAERCPHCDADLQGDPIPVQDQDAYWATHFSRKIGIYSDEQDRTVAWLCPDCSRDWPRG